MLFLKNCNKSFLHFSYMNDSVSLINTMFYWSKFYLIQSNQVSGWYFLHLLAFYIYLITDRITCNLEMKESIISQIWCGQSEMRKLWLMQILNDAFHRSPKLKNNKHIRLWKTYIIWNRMKWFGNQISGWLRFNSYCSHIYSQTSMSNLHLL